MDSFHYLTDVKLIALKLNKYFMDDREGTIKILCDWVYIEGSIQSNRPIIVASLLAKLTAEFSAKLKSVLQEVFFQILDQKLANLKLKGDETFALFEYLAFFGLFNYFTYLQRLISIGVLDGLVDGVFDV